MKYVDEYLKHLSDDNLNEFVVLPAVLMIYKLYMRYFSSYAKNCIGKKGKERSACIYEQKIKAIDKTIDELERYKETCKKYSTNPDKCIKQVNDMISKYKKKKKKAQQQIDKLRGKK